MTGTEHVENSPSNINILKTRDDQKPIFFPMMKNQLPIIQSLSLMKNPVVLGLRMARCLVQKKYDHV